MGADRNLGGVVLDEVLQCRHRGVDAGVVGDAAIR
jgi:hypothetical protein